MQYNYLGGGQESGRSSVGQALGMTYSPLENIQKMSQEFVSQGLSNAGANYRAQLAEAGADSRSRTARNDAVRDKKNEERELKKEKIAYLSELVEEQEMLIDAASRSEDPEQLRRLPELQGNVMRVRKLLSLNPSLSTLTGLLERNKDRASLEFESASGRGGLVAPKPAAKPEQKALSPSPKKEEKKEEKKEGTTALASSRKTIKL